MLSAFCPTLGVCAVKSPSSPGPPAVKVAYFENGPFWLFTRSYDALRQALHAGPAYTYSFPERLRKSPGWDASTMQMDAAARQLLESGADIIVAAGTSAAHALMRAGVSTKPILGIGLADPVAAGLMTKSGQALAPMFTTEVFPDRWRSMYRVFHEVVGFTTLGIMYPDSPEGHLYAAATDARAVAREAGFSLAEAVIANESPDACRAGIEDLRRQGANAFFIPPLVCFDWSANDPTPLLDLLHGYGMPTFARDGSIFVQGGAFMGFSTWNFAPSAARQAEAVEATLQGLAPADIRMVVQSEPRIAINLQVAKKLSIALPFDILLAADELYESIVPPKLD